MTNDSKARLPPDYWKQSYEKVAALLQEQEPGVRLIHDRKSDGRLASVTALLTAGAALLTAVAAIWAIVLTSSENRANDRTADKTLKTAEKEAGVAVQQTNIIKRQLQVAAQQSTAAEQQQLLAITTTIAGLLASKQVDVGQAGGALIGATRVSAIANSSVGIDNEIAADGQAAQAIIDQLKRKDITGVAYVQVGKALTYAGNMSTAIRDFNSAATAPHAPDTRANALRNEGQLLYLLGENRHAHADMMRAKHP